MSVITGTVSITGTLSKKDTEDNYPLVSQKDIKGGYRIVKNIAERDAITHEYLEDGMFIFVINESKEYVYKEGAWQEYIGSRIDDEDVSLGTTWSSEKIGKQIKGIIDDDVTTIDKTWSSDKINRIAEGIKSYAVSFNNDEKILTLIKFNNYHTEYDDETFTVLIKK